MIISLSIIDCYKDKNMNCMQTLQKMQFND